MRELKFRAWDKEKKEAINLIYLKPDNQMPETQTQRHVNPVQKEEDDFPF